MSHDLIQWLHTHHGVSHKPLVERRERPGAGSGLFAVTDCARSTTLLTIPASALLNIETLSPHYPSCTALSAVQLISLHLALHRTLSDPLYGPYISTLPQDFDFHPLTWLLEPQPDYRETFLINALPPSALQALKNLASRFQSDWQVVHQLFHHQVAYKDLLWGWLIVNTRCIYYPLHTTASHPDNLTLCPMLDFANHSSSGPTMSISRTDGITLLSPGNYDVAKDDELYLKYGSHCNRTLFVEYGFTEEITPASSLNGEVDVQDLLENELKQRCGLAPQIQSILEKDGYWSDWSLYVASGSGSVSFRLITALRLLQIPDAEFTPEMVQTWRNTHLGLCEALNQAHEGRLKALVHKICAQVEDRAKWWLNEHPENLWSEMEFIKILWKEEYLVAQAVIASSESWI